MTAPHRSPPRFRDELRGLVFHSSSALAMRGMRSLSSFLFNLVLARTLGASGSGAYFLALGVTELTAQVARLGMDPTVVRLLAGGQARSRAFYHRVLILVTAAGLATTILVWAAAPFICLKLFGEPDLIEPLRIMALGIVPLALASIHGSLLQSAGKIGLSIFIHYVALLLAAIPFLLLFAWDGSLVGAAFARLAAILTVLLIGVGLWRRIVREGFTLSDGALAPGQWAGAVRAGLSLSVIGLLASVSGQADTFLLGALGTMGDVGTFRVAFRIAALGGAALEAVRAAIAPRLAAYHSRGDWQALEQTGRAGTALAVLLTAPYWLLVLAFPAELLSLFGAEFTVASTVTVVLIVGRMMTTFTGPVGTLLTMAGHEKPLRDLALVFTTLRIVLLVLTVPIWGVLAVAVIDSVLDTMGALIATAIAHRRLGIVVLPLPRSVLPYRDDRVSR